MRKTIKYQLLKRKAMKIILGCDHGGFELKERLKSYLKSKGYDIEDMGAKSLDPQDDYSKYALLVAKKVGKAEAERDFQEGVKGILFCRSASGMVIAANKVKGIRAVSAFDETSARHSREHNAANVLALSGDWMDEEKAKKIASAWLETPFSNEQRHVRRLKEISDYEEKENQTHQR